MSPSPPADPVDTGEDAAESARGRFKRIALQQFCERGFAEVSVRDLTGALGLQPSALYSHFSSKEALLLDLVLDAHAEIERLLEVAQRSSRGEPTSDLVAHLYVLAVFHSEHRDLARVGQEVVHLPEAERDEVLARRLRIRDGFEQIVAAGQEHGAFAAHDVPLATSLLLRMAQSVSQFYRSEGRVDARTLARLVAQLGLQMVSSGADDVDDELLQRLDASIGPGTAG